MLCNKCKMEIPNGAKVCPFCGSKQGISCSGMIGALAFLIIVGFIISYIAINSSKGEENDSSTTSTASSSMYTEVVQTISPACWAVGINPNKIQNMKQIDNWEEGESYQFTFEGLSFTAYMNADGSLNSINCGTNKMYVDGEAKISYMNGFLVRDDGGTVNGETCEVNGIAMNVTGVSCSYVEINIGYYGSGGVKITSGLDNVLNLENGEQWRFQAYGFGSGISSYKIESITWY